jgi:alanine racemase
VLKDNAYGHGLVEIASMAKEYGIKKCVVRTSEEAKKIIDFFDYILVLSDTEIFQNSKVRYTINCFKSIALFPKGTKVELKVDTGMHRNGINKEDLENAFQEIKKANLDLEAIFTHHRSADELTSEWFWQNDTFNSIKEQAIKLTKKYHFKPLKFHSSNSASLFRVKNFNEDMARVGIVAYGSMQLHNSLYDTSIFKPVLSLYASKISSRILKANQNIGYGATYKSEKDLIVSYYDFGYGDGFLRASSNKFITPNGEKVIGRISMDNSSFISDKEELLIFNDAIVASSYANTISYEVLTSLKSEIPRIILQ